LDQDTPGTIITKTYCRLTLNQRLSCLFSIHYLTFFVKTIILPKSLSLRSKTGSILVNTGQGAAASPRYPRTSSVAAGSVRTAPGTAGSQAGDSLAPLEHTGFDINDFLKTVILISNQKVGHILHSLAVFIEMFGRLNTAKGISNQMVHSRY